jgi:tetratricopeptide (TPR) repeat protein/TolB-like protein
MRERQNSRMTARPKRASSRACGPDGSSRSFGPMAGRPRIAVLPFAASGSERSENLAFALAYEITGALGRSCRFEVIAGMVPESAVPTCFLSEHRFRRMKLDYLVDLTVAENGQATEISVRLLDVAGDARAIWSKRLGSTNHGVSQIGELAARHIIGHLDPPPPAMVDILNTRKRYGATGFLRRAVPLMFSMEREKFRQAGQLMKFALEIEPEDGEIATLAARWQHLNIALGYADHSVGEQAKVRDFALRAIKVKPDHAEALGLYAHHCAFAEKEFDTALRYFDRSLRINPSMGFIWALSSATYCYVGEPKTALERLGHYRELAPFDPFALVYEIPFTIAYLFNQDYERAASVGRRAVAAIPEFVNGYKPLIAALGHLGRREEAKPYLDKLLTLEPGFTVERFAEVYPIKKAADRRRYMDGLRLAGIPDR